MVNNVLNELIKKYNINSLQDETNAIKEIVQEIVLCALSRGRFFNEAALHEVRIYDKPSLFAGKIHAILCRNWKSRTKGRDLYDYIFYLSMDTKVNIDNLREKLINSKVLNRTDKFDINILKDMLYKKFDDIDFENAKDDVRAFIKDTKSLEVWNKDFFKQITEELN